LVPGLFQTSSYIRAIMEDAEVPAGEPATRVAVRIGRSDVLKRQPQPAHLTALVGEGALHLENRKSGLFLHADDDVAIYRRAVEKVLEVVMTDEQSMRHIASLVNEMEKAT
jgi:hypothetical protein